MIGVQHSSAVPPRWACAHADLPWMPCGREPRSSDETHDAVGVAADSANRQRSGTASCAMKSACRILTNRPPPRCSARPGEKRATQRPHRGVWNGAPARVRTPRQGPFAQPAPRRAACWVAWIGLLGLLLPNVGCFDSDLAKRFREAYAPNLTAGLTTMLQQPGQFETGLRQTGVALAQAIGALITPLSDDSSGSSSSSSSSTSSGRKKVSGFIFLGPS